MEITVLMITMVMIIIIMLVMIITTINNDDSKQNTNDDSGHQTITKFQTVHCIEPLISEKPKFLS